MDRVIQVGSVDLTHSTGRHVLSELRGQYVCNLGSENLRGTGLSLRHCGCAGEFNNDDSIGQVFRKAMNTDRPNDLNLDGHAASTAFLKYIWSDLLLFFLVLFHLSHGTWCSSVEFENITVSPSFECFLYHSYHLYHSFYITREISRKARL